jgi:predicted nucleic acid-binding protein
MVENKFVIDSSVIVKWFKKGEEFEEEALRLRDDVLSTIINLTICELTPLEVCRALIKAGYSPEKVNEAYRILIEMIELGFLKIILIEKIRDLAKDLIIMLNLYVIDALILATAITNSLNLLTEDTHLLKREVKEFMKKRELKIINLKDFYGNRF